MIIMNNGKLLIVSIFLKMEYSQNGKILKILMGANIDKAWQIVNLLKLIKFGYF